MPKTPQILIVEDNPADVVLIREALFASCHVCDFVFVEDYEAAKTRMESQVFHFVISDMGSDQKAIEEFVSRIRSDERHGFTPIIMFSGYPDPIPAYSAGANAFVAKGNGIDDLFRKIASILDF